MHAWQELLGLAETPRIWYIPGPETAPTYTDGKLEIYSQCRISVINLDNLVLEAVEPGPEPSPWKTFLEKHGEGLMHLAFFDLTPGVQLELIEPNEAPSVWRDHLNQYGEGIHHIAFQIKSGTSEEVIRQLVEQFDAVVEQQGTYGDGSGQYIYLSLHKQLACRIELLESYN